MYAIKLFLVYTQFFLPFCEQKFFYFTEILIIHTNLSNLSELNLFDILYNNVKVLKKSVP